MLPFMVILPTLFHLVVKLLTLNSLNAELNPICHLLALLGAHHILHVSRIRVQLIPFLPVSNDHYHVYFNTVRLIDWTLEVKTELQCS